MQSILGQVDADLLLKLLSEIIFSPLLVVNETYD